MAGQGGRRVVEGKIKINDYGSFKEFEDGLRQLRETASKDILGMVKPDNLQSTVEKNYKACVANFKERMDLLDGFAKDLISKRSELKETINMKEKESDTELEVMQAKSDLKNVQLFLSCIDAERKREESYKKIALEKYMVNYLKVEKFETSHKG